MQSFKNLEQEVTCTLPPKSTITKEKVGYEAHLSLARWVI